MHHSATAWGKPSRQTHHSATVWGELFSFVDFREQDVRTIQQQCGVNHFRSVDFHECGAYTISGYTGARSGLSHSIPSFSDYHTMSHTCYSSWHYMKYLLD